MQNFLSQFNQVFFYSPIGMALVSKNGKWKKVNPSLTKITGYTEEELLSTSFQDITHPDDLEADMKQVQALLEGDADSYEMEKRYIHKEGKIIWVLLSVSIVREGNESLYFIVQVQDITDRKQLEFNLSESEQRFRNILTYSPDPILVHDGIKILYANKSAADLVGVSSEDMIGKSIEEFIDPTQTENANRINQELLFHNKPIYDYDLKIRTKDGHYADAVLSAIPITIKERKAIVVSYRDITERRKMEKRLKESEERYRRLFHNSPLGILVYQKRIIKYANSTAIKLLGANKAIDIIGTSFHQFIHPDRRLMVLRSFQNLEDDEQFSTSYEKFIRVDGTEIDVEVNGIPVQLNGESAVQVVFWDVTERKKEEDLIRYRAYHDTLTDLPNRLKFQIDLEDEINNDNKFTIMFLDLHGLKQVNDAFGHQAGDMVLIKVTSRIAGGLGSEGLVYRLGGDEFAIVLNGVRDEGEIKDIAHNIEEVIKQPIYVANTIVQVTTSIGVVFYPIHGVDMDLLLRHADLAMYHAKNTGTLYKIYDN